MKLLLIIGYVIFISFFKASICNNNNFTSNFNSQNCDFTLCPYNGGSCFEGECICKICYKSVPMINDHRLCNYHQYSVYKATIIELFFPIGIGHFYLGNIAAGFLKMLLSFVLLCGLSLMFMYFLIMTREELQTNLYQRMTVNTVSSDVKKIHLVLLLGQVLFIILHIIDLLCIYNQVYKDKNNIELC